MTLTTRILTPALALGLAWAATTTAAAPAAAATPDQTARWLAGLSPEGFSTDKDSQKRLDKYAKTVTDKWASYWKRIATPMIDWAKAELAQTPGETIFYPFAGADFPTVAQLYPQAGRYVLVALQTGGRVPDLQKMSTRSLDNFLDIFRKGFIDFARRGFFRTDDLKADTGHEKTVEGVTPVLLAFAARMGFKVDSVTPIRINAAGTDVETHPGAKDDVATWDCVRLGLTAADGRKVTLDYLWLDLSDDYLAKHANAKAWLAVVARNKTFTKAASHLMQKPFFSTMSQALVANAPVVVQDETGLDYKDMAKVFDVQLYGRFERAHHLWTEGVQRELATAYKKAEDVKPLPFRFGYDKEAGSCLQVATRKK
ncbi:MAG: hypothetical protein KC635_23430 [Myxococcales bacterium]|nr:hypothetical protein [Myxococcales bacterium]MCB9735577.1 hypothetical protein [Deltaproteobacteria bacterium]